MTGRCAILAAVFGSLGCSDALPPVMAPPVPVDCQCMSPATATMFVGNEFHFAVTTIGGEVWFWSSSDTTIVQVSQGGFARGVGVGSAIITAISNLNHKATAAVSVVTQPPSAFATIRYINEIPANTPANLAAVFGTVEVGYSLATPPPASVALVVTRASGDTIVATVSPPTSPDGALRWNTADKTANGNPAFPNGSYMLYVAVSVSDFRVTTAHQQVTVANP